MSNLTARRHAREVLQAHHAGGLPVDVSGIVHARGLRVQTVQSIRPGVFGALYIDAADVGVYLSDECFSPQHRRFTLAHELGHYVIDGHVEALIPGGTGLAPSLGGNFRDQVSRFEREADLFAAELLMPQEAVASVVGETTPSIAMVQSLANECETSISSAAIRVTEATAEMAITILSYHRTIEWYACCPSLQDHKWARTRLKGEWTPERSVTSKAFSSRTPRNFVGQSTHTLLCEWFDGAPAECSVDEECIVLGDYGRVLTLLRPIGLATADELEESEQRDAEHVRDWRSTLRGYELD